MVKKINYTGKVLLDITPKKQTILPLYNIDIDLCIDFRSITFHVIFKINKLRLGKYYHVSSAYMLFKH